VNSATRRLESDRPLYHHASTSDQISTTAATRASGSNTKTSKGRRIETGSAGVSTSGSTSGCTVGGWAQPTESLVGKTWLELFLSPRAGSAISGKSGAVSRSRGFFAL